MIMSVKGHISFNPGVMVLVRAPRGLSAKFSDSWTGPMK